jgi:hypothetical protein
MDQVSGWSLRMASSLLWSHAADMAVLVTGSWMLAPLTVAFRGSAASVISPLALALINAPVMALLVPCAAHWWLALDSATAQASVALVTKYKQIPFWGFLLWCKTPKRCMKAVVFIALSSLAGVIAINQLVRNPMLQPGAASAWVPFVLASPFGFAAAVVILQVQLDRAQFAAIQQSRATRLASSLPAILSLTAAAWTAAALLAVAAAVLTPAPLPSALDCVLAAAASYGVVLCQLASAHLTGIVLAERPNLAQLDHLDQDLVRVEIIVDLRQQHHLA